MNDDLVDALVAGLGGVAAASVVAAVSTYRREAVESDEFPEPDYRQPDVVCGTTTAGSYIFLDVEDGIENARPVMSADDAVDLEENR